MASIGHIAVGMAAARIYRRRQRTRGSVVSSMVLWSSLSLLPDADVLGFRLGVAYAHAWGHRGATHSLTFCFALALALGVLAPTFGAGALRTGATAAAVLASHPLLDALTDGGLGCALLWPFESARYFAPWNPIPVAPIGRAMFSRVGAFVMLTELALFAPVFAYALWPRRAAMINESWPADPTS